MKAHIKILLWSNYTKKDGTLPLYLRVNINRRLKYYTLNLSCLEKNWNERKFLVKASDPESRDKNTLIDYYHKRARDIIFHYQVNGKLLTIHEFDRQFLNEKFGTNSVYDYVLSEITINQVQYAKETIRTSKSQVTKLKKFRPEVTFNEIDVHFLMEYENYMITVLNNKPVTVNKSFRWLKSIINKAIRDGIIKENVFDNYKIKGYISNREFLNFGELKKLEDLLKDNKLKENKANVLRYFLFSCYTGLRYNDVKNLKHKNIQDGMVSIKMHKTKDLIRIPLIERAKNLISPGLSEQSVFRVFSDQPTNRYLKEIMILAVIDKRISFHCARHTFATIALNLGIPMEVVSKLLGHKDFKTTQIYAKVMDSYKVNEMKKWEINKLSSKNLIIN